MRLLATAGGLPTTIVENAAPWEWMGVLQLLSDPGQVRFIEVDGFGGNFFHANLNSVTGLIFVSPHARLDFEWFTAAGRAPVVDFTLRFFMADGSQARSASTFSVNVLDFVIWAVIAAAVSASSREGASSLMLLGDLSARTPQSHEIVKNQSNPSIRNCLGLLISLSSGSLKLFPNGDSRFSQSAPTICMASQSSKWFAAPARRSTIFPSMNSSAVSCRMYDRCTSFGIRQAG
jgi:hypothetical protein